MNEAPAMPGLPVVLDGGSGLFSVSLYPNARRETSTYLIVSGKQEIHFCRRTRTTVFHGKAVFH